MKFTFKPKVLLLTLLCVGVLSTFSTVLAQTLAEQKPVVIYVPQMIGEKPHRAPARNVSNVIYLKFMQEMQDVKIEVYENDQLTNVISEETVYSDQIINVSVKEKTGIQINIYSEGFFVETLTI